VKVLHIAHGAPGGIGRVELLLARVWANDDTFEVDTIRRRTYPRYLQGPSRKAPAAMGRLRWALTIARACLRSRADVVILNHLNLTPAALLIRCFRPSSRVVVWAYGVEAWRRPDGWRRIGLRQVDQVWSISAYTASTFSGAAGFPRDRITVVPLALLPERAQALGRPHLADDGGDRRYEVLTVSRLTKIDEAKGIDHLIQALAATPSSVHLRVVGDGDDRPRLERLARAAGVASRVTFSGQVDDATLIELYRRCSLFALPSVREGFGLVFLEAMAAAKPVIAARAAALPELVRDGETGLLVPFSDRQALAAAINALVADPALAAILGNRGRQRVLREFGFHRFAGQIAELLAKLRRAGPIPISSGG